MHQLVARFVSSLFSYYSLSRFAILAMGPECCAPLTVDCAQWSGSDQRELECSGTDNDKIST